MASWPTSSPALDQWRPTGERLTYKDVAWTGAGAGVVMHATLNFFSVAIPALERFLVLFAPAQRFAFAVTRDSFPLATWLVLILSEAVFWALVGVALLALWREVAALVRRVL
jgi:hypothetical protein